MFNGGFLRLLLIFLGFSCFVFAAAAVPATRSPDFEKPDHLSSLASPVRQGEVLDMSDGGELVRFEDDASVEGRMDLETNDYEGTGANRDHDPKTPGRVY